MTKSPRMIFIRRESVQSKIDDLTAQFDFLLHAMIECNVENNELAGLNERRSHGARLIANHLVEEIERVIS